MRELLINLLMGASVVAAERPNILFIIADDHGWRDSGAYGSPDAITPNLDRLAKEGLRFDRAFSTSPLCTPARLAIASARWPDGTAPSAKANVNYLADGFRAAGYQTVSVAKTELGRFAVNLKCPPTTAAPAAAWIREHGKGEPFFMAFGAEATHISGPPALTWPDKNRERYQPEELTLPGNLLDTPETRVRWRDYLAAVTTVDQQVGELWVALEATGLLDSTIIVYTSDQGSTWPFAKWCNYDEGIRVPLSVRWPAHVPAGTTTRALVSHVDLAPTFFELTGIAAPKADVAGRSFAGVLKEPKRAFREVTFASHRGDHGRGNHAPIMDGMPDQHHNRNPGLAIRTVDDRKFIINTRPDVPFGIIENGYCNTAVLNGLQRPMAFWDSWVAREKSDPAAAKLIRQFLYRPANELYAVANDPWEQHDLASDPAHREEAAVLKKQLLDWQKEFGVVLPDYGPRRPEERRWDDPTGTAR